MELDRAIKFTDRLLLGSRQRELSELEILVFKSIWLDISYQESSQDSNYETATIKNTASKLLQDISDASGEKVAKKNCKSVLTRLASTNEERVDWGNAPTDTQPFCGRSDELTTLTRWLTIDRCKLVGMLGMGGIGKTALAAKLGEDIADDFELAIWRSLREAPPLAQLLGELVQFLSAFTEIEVPSSSSGAISRLLYHLRRRRCLLVLDNVEAIMEAGDLAGNYRAAYADYGELFHSIGTSRHQSSLLFTSREPPPELAELAGDDLPVRSLWLSGLTQSAATLLDRMGLNGTEGQLLAVAERCQGNPLYLRIVANTIANSFNGEIDNFLTADRYTYGKITTVLQSQLDRLSPIEKLIIYYLAIEREPISIYQIERHLQSLGYDNTLMQTIDSLQRRSLLEVTQGQRYTLQNVVMEFMTAATLRELVSEITNANLAAPLLSQEDLFFFNNLALHPASSPTYVRDVQYRTILRPLVDRLCIECGGDRTIELCRDLLANYRQAGLIPGYGVGNLIDIFLALEVNLQGENFTNTYIAEVDFQTANLHAVNFTGATFDRCRFAQGMGSAVRMAFSDDGKYLAVCDTNFQIKVWEVASNREIAMLVGHQGWVWDAKFSGDNKYLISGSSDRTLRIWELASGECARVICGHCDWVWRVNFAVNNNLAISIGADRSVKIWWWRTGLNLLTFRIPNLPLRDGTYHVGHSLLAVCGQEGIKVWQIWNGREIQHINTPKALNLRAISFSPDGRSILGANFDCTVYAWDLATGDLKFNLCGHPTQISEINYDNLGRIITTCLTQIRIWNAQTGNCIKAIDFGGECGKGVAYRSPLMATGSDNGTIKIWNLETGQCVSTSGGNATRILGLATSDNTIACSKDDGTISIWHSERLGSHQPPHLQIRAHRGMSGTLAFSPNGKLLASAGSDRAIKIWDVKTGDRLQTLLGHTDYIPQLLFVDDRTIISQSYDKTIRWWDLITGDWQPIVYRELQYLVGFGISPSRRSIAIGSDAPSLIMMDCQTRQFEAYPATGNRLRRMAFSHDERYIIGISDDRILNLWDTAANYRHRAWEVGEREIMALIPHPTLAHIAILGTEDGTLAVWDLDRQICLDSPMRSSVRGHTRDIMAMAIVPNPPRLISAGMDGAIKVWGLADNHLTEELCLIDFGNPYRDLQLTNVKGLNRAQLKTLELLGAIVD